jgi:5-hydroxyisourate hydrolase-like protein (transthyretin family)
MNITVTVIDGMHGQPAEGIEVAIVSRQDGVPVEQVRGHTDRHGQLEYSDQCADRTGPASYHVEIDIDAYYATLGIVSWHKKVATFFRVLNPEDTYRVSSFITPFAQATSCAR